MVHVLDERVKLSLVLQSKKMKSLKKETKGILKINIGFYFIPKITVLEDFFPWMIIRACSKKTFMFSILWHLKRIFNREHESGWLVCAEQNHWVWPLKNAMNCTLAHGQSVDPERMCLWVQCSELKCYHKRVFLPAHFTAPLLSYKYVRVHAVHSIVHFTDSPLWYCLLCSG